MLLPANTEVVFLTIFSLFTDYPSHSLSLGCKGSNWMQDIHSDSIQGFTALIMNCPEYKEGTFMPQNANVV